MPDHSSDQPFFFIANYLCLDFINTQIAESGRPVDLLKSFGDLVSGASRPVSSKRHSNKNCFGSGAAGGTPIRRSRARSSLGPPYGRWLSGS